MLRSAFRGKQPADSTAKEEKHASSEHGKSHFFFHHDHHHEEQDRKDQITNLNDDGIRYNASDGELYIDCNQEFVAFEESSSSERESRNEANGSGGEITSEESFPANSGPIPKNVGGAGTNDYRKESFSNSERQIYEMQLAQLQEQLVNTMIDHQELSTQLEKLKAINVEKLQKELQEEREKNFELKEKLRQKQKSVSSKLQRKNASRVHHKQTDVSEKYGDEWVDLGREEELPHSSSLSHDASETTVTGDHSYEHEQTDNVHDGVQSDTAGQSEQQTSSVSGNQIEEPHRVQRVKTKLDMWKMKVLDLILDRLWDFVNDEPEGNDEEDGEGEPLAVKRLKENINRFTTGIKPITGFIKSFGRVFSWSNPTASLLIFVVYMYSVWNGYLLSLILFVAIWKLFMNYLHAKGIAKQLGFVDKTKDEGNSSEDHSWSDKFQLVLQVARKVQNTLGKMADSLEKLKNLLMWQHHEATRKLFTALCVGLLASLLLKGPTLFLLLGLFGGIKFFIINPIQNRFPKVKRRYDSTSKLWRELPTDAELAARPIELLCNEEALSHTSSSSSSSSPSNNHSSETSGSSSNPFAERFRLPSSETPLPGWEDGKRCVLLDKDKSFSHVKHGRLFLTQSYLCFEKSRSLSGKHIVIKLDAVTSLLKAKPIGIMPGTGMAIEVQLRGIDKPYIFGAIIGRDDVFDNIKATARAANIPWAQD